MFYKFCQTGVYISRSIQTSHSREHMISW